MAQAIITHGTLSSLDFSTNEADILVQTASIKASADKKAYKSSAVAARGCDVALQFRNPTATMAIDGYLISDAGFKIKEVGTAISTLANFTNLGTAFGHALATGKTIFEDPSIDGSAEEAIKISFNAVNHPFVS